MPLAGFGEIDQVLARHDQIARLHLIRQHGNFSGWHFQGHHLLVRSLRAGIKAPVGPEFQSAALRRVCNEGRNFAVRPDPPDARAFAEIEEVEVALTVGAGGIGKTESFGDQLPALALDQHFRQRFVAGEVLRQSRVGNATEHEKRAAEHGAGNFHRREYGK